MVVPAECIYSTSDGHPDEYHCFKLVPYNYHKYYILLIAQSSYPRSSLRKPLYTIYYIRPWSHTSMVTRPNRQQLQATINFKQTTVHPQSDGAINYPDS